MPAPSDEPLRKVTMNFFASDIAALEALGPEWTLLIRRLVRDYVRENVQNEYPIEIEVKGT